MKHIQLQIVANQFQQEELIALLDDYNPTGFEQTDELVKAYFEADHFDEKAIGNLIAGYDHNMALIEEQNWNAVWEENFQPVVVDDFCAVRAHFHKSIANVEHEIIITPKMSFGTGHHATTFMMMQHMRDIDFKDKAVFDFGTGTGILAILAEKLCAAKVTAIDVDSWSIENAAENFSRNDCRKISVSLSSNLPVEQFDVVLANINRNVILLYMQHLSCISKQNGLILFSGLLVADKEDILKAAKRHGLRSIKQIERSGWLSLLFVNNA